MGFWGDAESCAFQHGNGLIKQPGLLKDSMNVILKA
jgi:hypothetical protein